MKTKTVTIIGPTPATRLFLGMNSNMRFPVITFSDPGYMLSLGTGDALTRTGVDGLRRGVYKDVFLVDSDGLGYEIENAEKVGWAGPLWGLSLLRKRAVRVRLIFKRSGFPVELTELKDLACLAVRRQRWFFGNLPDVDGTQAKVRAAKTHREIIEMFLKP